MNRLFVASAITLTTLIFFVGGLVIFTLLLFDAVNIFFAISLTIIINIILWLAGPAINDWLFSWFYKLQFLTDDEVTSRYPSLAALIKEVSHAHQFPFPRIGIIPDKNPTAFTYGSGRYNARIILTEGIFEFLTDEEQRAVVAHELGHIVNGDFVVMMIASTLVQILYEIYAVLIRARGRKSGTAKLLGLVAYGLYLLGIFLVYYLSRTREYLADAFASKTVSPAALSQALMKIAYGIVAADDAASTARLLESTRQLGIVDVKNAKHLGIAVHAAHHDPAVLSEVVVFDRVSPWAKVMEIISTHPLTGNRLAALARDAAERGLSFPYDVDAAIARLRPDPQRLHRGFIPGLIVFLLPYLLALIPLLYFLFTSDLLGSSYFHGWLLLSFCFIWAGYGAGLLLQIPFRFPSRTATPATVLEAMRDVYASPIFGKPIQLSGKVVGRGVPGYIFSEDMMYQDATGLMYLDFHSLFGFIGNFFFALKKYKTLLGQESKAAGWFFRGMGSILTLQYIETPHERIRSHPVVAQICSALILIALSYFFYLQVSPWIAIEKDFQAYFPEESTKVRLTANTRHLLGSGGIMLLAIPGETATELFTPGVKFHNGTIIPLKLIFTFYQDKLQHVTLKNDGCSHSKRILWWGGTYSCTVLITSTMSIPPLAQPAPVNEAVPIGKPVHRQIPSKPTDPFFYVRAPELTPRFVSGTVPAEVWRWEVITAFGVGEMRFTADDLRRRQTKASTIGPYSVTATIKALQCNTVCDGYMQVNARLKTSVVQPVEIIFYGE